MIQCKGCGFSVNELMRFALMKNVCPSCGAGLLSGRDADIISVIQGKLSSQRFSTGLTDAQKYDISLFLYNELKGSLGKIALELSMQAKKKVVEEDSDEFSHSEDDEDLGEDISSLRREVLAELETELENVPQRDEDSSSKAERLKKLYQQRVLTEPDLQENPTSKFRRSGFKGVTRST
jgi:hypothetical protein